MDYLGRYTHRVAISNNRVLELKGGQVTFTYKDYKHEQRQKVVTLSADEFLRRFLLHVLPDGFQRIRHYGLLGNRSRSPVGSLPTGLIEKTIPLAEEFIRACIAKPTAHE